MRYFHLSASDPAEYLAIDEVLLDQAENGVGRESLHTWASAQPFIVIGYSNSAKTEVNLAETGQNQMPILRRMSGGGTVVQGPGCLNYSLILDIERHAELASITRANQYVMGRNREAIQRLVTSGVSIQGCTDMVVNGRKFSGNAQRRKRRFLVFHGALLLDFDLAKIGQFLAHPSKEPGYRAGRSHADFLVNLHLPAETVIKSLRSVWGADEEWHDWPRAEMEKLAREKYAGAEWNFKNLANL